MEKTIEKNGNKIIVTAKFIPRSLHDRRLRFYSLDALRFVEETFPDLSIIQTNNLTITNYSLPYDGEWHFEVVEEILKVAMKPDIVVKTSKKKNKESELESDIK